jgi:hypothetical protein
MAVCVGVRAKLGRERSAMRPGCLAIPQPFRYDSSMCPGESLGRHQHYGFWTRSSVRPGAEKRCLGGEPRAPRKAGLAETVGDEEKWLKAAKI